MTLPRGPWLLRFTLPKRLFLLGLLGVLLSAFVLQSAVDGFSHVSRSNRAAALISKVQRYHQDADQAHDALHADVLAALRVGGTGGTSETRRQVLRDLTADGQTYRTNIDKVRSLHVGGSLGRALSNLRPAQLDYVGKGERIGKLALRTSTPPDAELASFNKAFTDLLKIQAAVTDQLTQAVDATTADRDRAQAGAESRIITACLIALLGLVVLAFALARMGRRLDVMVSREHEVARTLQQSLIPEQLPDVIGLQLAARYLPAAIGHDIGGDWYDVVALPTGEVAFIIADVMGHDIGAASVMGHLRNVVRTYALDGLSPSEVLRRLNRLLTTFETDQLATCVYGVIDKDLSSVTMANAGHCPPLVIDSSGVAVIEVEACPPLGAVANVCFSQTTHPIAPGSTTLLYTDGLIERRQESFQDGENLLVIAAAPANWVGVAGANPDLLCDTLLRAFSTGVPTDDVALLAFTTAVSLGDTLDMSFAAAAEEIPRLRRALSRWLAEIGAADDEMYTFTVACAEAASNSIEHAYDTGGGTVDVTCTHHGGTVTAVVRDHGQWRPPRGMDRGRGTALMSAFTDAVQVTSTEAGTEVRLQLSLHAGHSVGGTSRPAADHALLPPGCP
jgi:serine phosphatase RsbU (regulator of sigma subunit)/anti-sigma regulatory factor (Ser/Thr protein kinase)